MPWTIQLLFLILFKKNKILILNFYVFRKENLKAVCVLNIFFLYKR